MAITLFNRHKQCLGIPIRMDEKGSIPSTAIRVLKKLDGTATKSVSQTVEFLLNSLIPNHETDPRNDPLPVSVQ